MIRSHKIELDPNNLQKTYFAKACGCARFTYNWALAEWIRLYEAGLKPTAFSLKKAFNAIKHQQFPFMQEVTKCSPEKAFADLDTAFKKFFKKQAGYPAFHKKGVRDSFHITAQHFEVEGCTHHIEGIL